VRMWLAGWRVGAMALAVGLSAHQVAGQVAGQATGGAPVPYDAKSGQTLTDADPFSRITLEEALAESIRRNRYLVVAIPTGGYATPSQHPMWKSRMVRAWIAWHAVLVEVPATDRRRLAALRAAAGPTMGSGDPLVFVHGRWVRLFGSDFAMPNNMATRMLTQAGVQDLPRPTNSGISLVLKLDLTDEATRATNPVWHANHTRLNPPPEQLALEPLHQTGDDDGPPLHPVVPGDDGLQLLERAREAMRAGRGPEAISLYTLLWEQAHVGDPAMAAVRVITVAPEVAALAGRNRAAKRRFENIRTQVSSRRDWFGPRELDDYLTLSDVLGDRASGIEVVAEMLGMHELWQADDETATSLPRRMGFMAVTRRPRLSVPTSLDGGVALGRIAALRARAMRVSGTIFGTQSDRDAAVDAFRWLGVSEACRQNVRAVKVALEADPSPMTRLMLVASALAGTPVTDERPAGESDQGRPLVRPMHRALLAEAAQRGVLHPHLHERVELMLAPAENQDGPPGSGLKGVDE
jgi:hypothetical protein